MRHIKFIYFLLPFLATAQISNKQNNNDNFFICYGKIAPETVKGYHVVIIESQLFTAEEIAVFKKNNQKVVGYISLTEVHPTSTLYADLENFTFGKNEIWNSYYIDISKIQAQKVLLDEVSRMLKKGLDGLFLDNLDNVSEWGVLKSQKDTLVAFIKTINNTWESIYLIQNAGLFVSDELANSTDVILVESVVTLYDFEKKEYAYRAEVEKKNIIKNLKAIKKKNKQTIYILDYANEYAMKTKVENELSTLKMPFFIANIDLQNKPFFYNSNK